MSTWRLRRRRWWRRRRWQLAMRRCFARLRRPHKTGTLGICTSYSARRRTRRRTSQSSRRFSSLLLWSTSTPERWLRRPPRVWRSGRALPAEEATDHSSHVAQNVPRWKPRVAAGSSVACDSTAHFHGSLAGLDSNQLSASSMIMAPPLTLSADGPPHARSRAMAHGHAAHAAHAVALAIGTIITSPRRLARTSVPRLCYRRQWLSWRLALVPACCEVRACGVAQDRGRTGTRRRGIKLHRHRGHDDERAVCGVVLVGELI